MRIDSKFDYDAALAGEVGITPSPKHQEFVERLIAVGVLPQGSEAVVDRTGLVDVLGIRHGGTGKLFKVAVGAGHFCQEAFVVEVPVVVARPAEHIRVSTAML